MATKKSATHPKLLTTKRPLAKTEDELAYEEYLRLLALAIENH